MADRKKILMTGAAGYIANQMLPRFRARYHLVLVDVTRKNRQGEAVADIAVVDLIDPDREKYARHFEGVHTVVHLGYKRRAGANPLDHFFDEKQNVEMAYNVFRTAYDAGVDRVVMASSNHAADWYEHALIHTRRREMVYPEDLPLSDNFYGWAKASYELLGFVYACGAFGRTLEVVQVRIGAPRDVAGRHYEGSLREQHTGPGGSGLANFKRDLGAWVSERDLRQLFVRAVDVPDIRDTRGVPWLVVYGISGNTRAFWSLESARRVLGYAPEDDSEVRYADDVRRLLTGPDAAAPGGRLGA